MNIAFNKDYISSLIISTDRIGGGHLTSMIHRRCLCFSEDGTVVRSKRLVDQFIPAETDDIIHIRNYKIQGAYQYEGRYLQCRFEESDTVLFGRLMNDSSDILLFHAFDSRINRKWSELYMLKEAIKPGQFLF